MTFGGRRVLRRTLVVLLVSFHGRRRNRGGTMMVTVPRTRDLTGPEQRRDQKNSGQDAGSATIEHDGV